VGIAFRGEGRELWGGAPATSIAGARTSRNIGREYIHYWAVLTSRAWDNIRAGAACSELPRAVQGINVCCGARSRAVVYAGDNIRE
jgi:hypothetical protein